MLSAVELNIALRRIHARSMEIIVRAVSARFNAAIKYLTRCNSRAAAIKLTFQLILNPGLFS